MAYQNGIVGVNPDSGKTIISYNGVRFYTTDKSVIAMAARGNVAGAAKRYIGKSSTARALRKANREATKPIYKNVAESLYNKVFKQKDLNKLNLDKESLSAFRKKYRETVKQTEQYINEAVKDAIGILDIRDRIPETIRTEVDHIISEEIEKAYSEKGQIESSDYSRISNRIRDLIEDYKLSEDISDSERYELDDITESIGYEPEGLQRL